MKIFRFSFSWLWETKEEPPGPSCVHLEKDSIFRKRGMRYDQRDLALLNFNEGYRLKLTSHCNLCREVYPFWANHCNQYFIQPMKGKFEFPDPTALAAGNTRHSNHDSLQLPNNNQQSISAAVLKDKEFGEAYHVLMCCLYCRISGAEFPMTIYLPTGDFGDQMRDLFHWYGIPNQQQNTLGKNTHEVSKKVATATIAATFRQSLNNGAEAEQSHPSTLFHVMRQYMDSQNLKTTKAIENNKVMERYFYPSWEAKYWLNRYLCLTSQRRLPKKHKVSRLAVIHVRSRAKTGIGRVMDDGNLKHVAQSIARANERIIAWNSTQPPAGAPFTHVILYGDFDYPEGSKLKKLVKEQTGPNVKVLYISQPWTSAQASSGSVAASAEQLSMPGSLKRASSKIMSGLVGTTKDVNAEVSELWGTFQDIRFDAMPIQVKILGIWTALGKRYGPKVCVIGHRSGFVEGAGFIGIPAFYLNNERRDLEKQLGSQTDNKTVHSPGELLWGPVRMPKTDRLRELSDVMNTFIPVEALGEKNAKGILQVDKKYESELMSALFIFMCCDVVGFGIGPGRGTVQPGWTARVAMMHDQSGQDWLRERYDFANINGDGEVPLPTWTGYARNKWLEGVKAIEEYELELQRMGFITIE